MEEQNPIEQQTPQKKSNSKIVLVIGLVGVLILLGVGGYMVMGKSTPQNSANQTQTATTKSKSPNLITSIKDALASSMSLKCEFKDAELGTTSVAYIKAGAIRTDFTGKNPNESGSAIMKNNTMYFWNGKEGMTMKFDLEKVSGEMKSNIQNQSQNPNEIIENLEKYKDSCTQSNVADSLFVPPSDVKFTDLSSFTNESMKAIPSISADQEMTKEKVEELQKQFQQ